MAQKYLAREFPLGPETSHCDEVTDFKIEESFTNTKTSVDQTFKIKRVIIDLKFAV